VNAHSAPRRRGLGPDVLESPVSAGAGRKPSGARLRLPRRDDAPAKLVRKRFVERQAELLPCRQPITAQRCLRESGQVLSETLGGGPGGAVRHHLGSQANLDCLGCAHRPSGQYEVERTTEADQPRQANRAAIE